MAVILAAFAFSGMETVLGASGELADAHRTLPRALFGAMGFVLVLYVAVQLVAGHLLGDSLARSAAPLADAAGRVAGPFRVLLVAGAALSMLGWIGSDILGAPPDPVRLRARRAAAGPAGPSAPADRGAGRGHRLPCAAGGRHGRVGQLHRGWSSPPR